MVQIVFTSSGSFADPGDWNSADNKIECVGTSSRPSGAPDAATGGGGYAVASNVTPQFPVAITAPVANNNVFVAAQQSAFGAYCYAYPGNLNGTGAPAGFPTGYAGGSAATGGGGAAGPHGAGFSGSGNNGGAGDAGNTPGGAGGASPTAGGSGNQWGLYGSGGGGGATTSGLAVAGAGGQYGGGAGANYSSSVYSVVGGGLVVITYTPLVAASGGAMAMVIG